MVTAGPFCRWDYAEKQEQDTGAEQAPHAGKQAGVQPGGAGGGEPQRCTSALVQGALPQLPGKGLRLP